MSASERPILLAGRFGFGDLGDEAVLDGLVSEIRRRDPATAIVAISGHPPGTAERLSIEAVDFYDLVAIDRAIARSRRVLFGLGGVFQNDGGAPPGDLFREKTVGIEADARPALLAALHGVPSALFAAGVSSLPAGAARLFAMACEAADLLVVRDEASADEVRACGVLAPVCVGGDAAYLLEAGDADSEEAARLLSDRGLDATEFVVFVLGSDSTGRDAVARAAAGLSPDCKAVFVPLHRGAGSGDRELATKAAQACGPRGVLVEARTPAQLLGLLARARAVVTTRLHGVVLAASSGTPVVSFASDPAVVSEALRLGMEPWILSPSDDARLPQALREAAAAGEDVRARLAASARACRRDAAAAFELLDPPADEAAPRPPTPAPDLPRTLGRLAGAAAGLRRESAAHHRRLRDLALRDASREILALEGEHAAREDRVQRELAGELTAAAERGRTERERWLAELMRVRAACWDVKSRAELRTAEVRLEVQALEARLSALEAQRTEEKNVARHQRSLLERQLMEARVEIMRFQSSRLWRAANVFWSARRRLRGERPAGTERRGTVAVAPPPPGAPAPEVPPPATDTPPLGAAAVGHPMTEPVPPAPSEAPAPPNEPEIDPADPPETPDEGIAAAPAAPASRNGLVGPPEHVDLPGPFGVHAIGGRCIVCGRDTDFVYDDPAAWREQLACLLCRTTSRYRSIARGLLEGIRTLRGVEAASVAELPRENPGERLAIYDTQLPFAHMASAYPIPELLSRCSWIDLEMSTWKRRRKLGRRLGPRTTNQNLERLTFADASFDIVVTSDVMEHVRLEDRAHKEIRRILKPGGIYIFTVPYMRNQGTIVRVEMPDPDDPSQDRHVYTPEYHGDANDPGGRSLAYRNFGIDLDSSLEALGFDVSYHRSDLEQFGILGTELFFCRLRG